MSSLPERPESVQSLVEFLQATHRDIRKGDRVLHSVLRDIEGRLYALRRAEDPDYLGKRQDIQELLDAGTPPEDSASFEEVASLQGADPES